MIDAGDKKNHFGLNPSWRDISSQVNHSDRANLPVLTAANRIRDEKLAIKEKLSETKEDLIETKARLDHDELTGARSRAFYNEYKEKNFNAEADHLKIAVIVIDLNEFKIVNDTRGHEVGDEILKMTTAFFKSFFRQGDQVVQLLDEIDDVHEVIRPGGDEFLIICRNTKDNPNFKDELNKKMLQLQQRTDRPINFSYGIALFDKNLDKNLDQTQSRADETMYKNKESNVNKFKRFFRKIYKLFLGNHR